MTTKTPDCGTDHAILTPESLRHLVTESPSCGPHGCIQTPTLRHLVTEIPRRTELYQVIEPIDGGSLANITYYTREAAIRSARTAGLANDYEYGLDEDALADFCAVHWATRVDDVEFIS